jgi:putative endonuclease
MNKIYYTYIMTNIHNTVFYTGITNDLGRRTEEHTFAGEPGFTQKYRVTKVVWYEEFLDPMSAIAAEKKIKGWVRKKKIALIKNSNPTFADLMKNE